MGYRRHPLSQLIQLTTATLLAGSLATSQAFAQGAVQGRVTDYNGSVGMEGAVITVKELNVRTTSGRDGFFSLPELPAGHYTLVIQYIGSTPQEIQLDLADGETAVHAIALQPDDEADEQVLVIGQGASLNKALNKQRSSNSITNIVNADAIGQYPDANTSEALQRLPGVSVENDQGEGRFVRIRGLGANFNSVTINGAHVPSPNAGERAVALDTVPSDLLESLEVTKTLTPDMDADSLGGTINVKSLSAFDRSGFFYRASVEANYDEHSGQTSPKLALVGSKKLSLAGDEDNFGIAAAVSWFDRDFGSDNVETGGAWDFDTPTRLEEFEQRDYTINRERLGASINFDYRPTNSTDLYLRTLYSEFTDSEIRQANVFELYEFERDNNGNIIEDDEGDPVTIDGLVRNQTGAATVARELKDRTETMTISSLVLGGETRMKTWTVDYQLGYSESSEDTPYYIDTAAFEAEFDDGMGFTDNKMIRPLMTADALSTDEYELDEVEAGQTLTEDTETSFKLDIEKQLQLGRVATAIKFGGKFSQREKTSNEDVWVFEDFDEYGFSDDQLLLTAYAGSPIDYSLGNMGAAIVTRDIEAAISGMPKDTFFQPIDSAVADFKIEEDITAAYVMGTFDIDRLRLIAGLRNEQTDFSANGYTYEEYEVEDGEVERLFPESYNNDYSHLLPALHARYGFTENTLLRAAWTHSVVRPTFEQLSPGKVREGDELEFGNPLLDPLESANFDLGIEHYAGYASYFSAFAFYKQIDNFVYAIDLGDTVDPDIAGPGEVSEANTFKNGDKASIRGLELAASQQFTSLPAPWNGLMAGANVTWSESDARIDYLDDGAFARRDLILPGQSDVTGNLTVGYENRLFSLRLAANYKSEYLLEVTDAGSEQGDVWVDSQLSLDFLARWNATKGTQIFFQAVNLGDEPYYTYIGKASYNNQYEEYGPTYRLGISFSQF